ncbi:MAG TPA: DUF6600 domain-containing protein [Terriglobia bacterium]|nr:DUF6600 domain-containing protein [Terriglobia bacterium]
MIVRRLPGVSRLLLLLVAALITFTLHSIPSSAAQSNSQVRIARLSFVEGTVKMYRPDVGEWAKVFVNTPIQQGFKLATDANSFAEVEFENSSTARLGQSSSLDFTSLSLSPEGGKINQMSLAQGYATFTVTAEQGDVYEVHAAGVTYAATAKTVFRVDLGQGDQRLEVFKGKVDVQSPYGNATVAKNRVLELVPGGKNPFQISHGIREDAWDHWVSKRQKTETLAGNRVGPKDANWSRGSSLYGWNDLSYYGDWTYLPGFGYGWIPMMGAGWSPYSIGSWGWYPGMGYTWISGLPWGWLPFHYGNWSYMTGYGWCWLPGNFSTWSPGMVTWYQGPGWVGWSPRTYTGSFNTQAGCPTGQNCSTAVSLNTFQSGRPISPNDVVRVDPSLGRIVTSPTARITRNLRFPGPAVAGTPLTTTTDVASGGRFRRTIAAPTRIFAGSTIRGAWDVQPHAPSVFDRHTRSFVNRSNRAFQALQRDAVNPERRMPDFRRNNFPGRNQSRENAEFRRQMEMNRRSEMQQQRVQRAPASRPSSGGFGGGQRMGQSQAPMGGGMRGGNSGGMGGGMRSGGSGGMGGGTREGGGGGGGSRGPHH